MAHIARKQISKSKNKPLWVDISGRYTDERECLAAFLAFQTAEVLEGIKPSTLINLADWRRRCGRNFHELWREHGASVVHNSTLEARVMAVRPGSMLLLIYDRAALTRLLADKGVHVLLRKAGYGAVADVDNLLDEMAGRFAAGGMPHEIGIILGYPLKDVAGFMGMAPLRFTCQGPWRIYGDPLPSLQLAEAHRECRCRMAERLLAGCRPLEFLAVSGNGQEALQDRFFAH